MLLMSETRWGICEEQSEERGAKRTSIGKWLVLWICGMLHVALAVASLLVHSLT